jgi:hypothetical protein
MIFRDIKSASRRQDPSNRRPRVDDVEHQWKVHVFRFGSHAGPVFVDFSFPTRDGRTNEIRVPYNDLRHRGRLLDELTNRLPLFPRQIGSTDRDRFAFIQELVTSHGDDRIGIEPDRTGFFDQRTFVTFSEIIHSHGTIRPRRVLGRSSSSQHYQDLRGSLKGAKNTVLSIARKSTYLAWVIGVALATPIPEYVQVSRRKNRDIKALLSETAMFNFSGHSGAGKTKALLAAMSLAGSPDRAETLDCTRRALAELASDSNSLPCVLDDTEKMEDGVLIKTLKSIVHMVPGGRSKKISRGVDQTRFPDLRWSTFGLSSSPRPIAALAAEAHWTMTRGDIARVFDISVPSPKSGGIFDQIGGSKANRAAKSIALIEELELGYTNNCGHVFRAWALYLMRKDRSKKILALMNSFVDSVCLSKDGWEVRFARKFGVVYAAMMLGIAADILPWSPEFAFAVAKNCYEKARDAAPGEQRKRDHLRELKQLINDHTIDVTVNQRKPIDLPSDHVVLRYRKNGRRKYGLLDDVLLDLCGSWKAKTALTDTLAKEGVLANGHGHAGTVQEHLPIMRGGHVTKKPRLWVIDVKKFENHLKQASR